LPGPSLGPVTKPSGDMVISTMTFPMVFSPIFVDTILLDNCLV
jgi:hypothetical protein